MGLDLTWNVEDKKRFGNCGSDLKTIIHFRFPESSVFKNGGISDSPDRDSHYALYYPESVFTRDLDIPEGEKGYALEFTEMDVELSMEETVKRLRNHYERNLPKDLSEENKDKYIHAQIQEDITPGSISSIGTTFVAGMVLNRGRAEISIRKFIRWVSKDEYEKRMEDASKREDGEEVWLSNKWDMSLNDESIREKCSKCPLNISGGIYGCSSGMSYGFVSSFLDFISKHGNFPLLSEQMNSDGMFKTEYFGQLEYEVLFAKEILESKKTPAINVYDKDRKIIRVLPYRVSELSGNQFYGYGVGLEGKEKAISVIFQGKSIFDVPVEVRRKVINSDGLEGIMAVCAEMDSQEPRLYFKEIYREGNTFFGKTSGDNLVELPPMPEDTPGKDPLSTFGEDAYKIEYTEVSANESFYYIIELFDKYLAAAKKFDISIKGA